VAVIDQGGAFNTAEVAQSQGNSLEIVQRGAFNASLVDQGDGNLAVVSTSGDFRVVELRQGVANLAFSHQGGIGTSTASACSGCSCRALTHPTRDAQGGGPGKPRQLPRVSR